MAYGYWKQDKADQQSAFHLFFRSNPFHGGYVVATGLQPALELIRDLCFQADDQPALGGVYKLGAIQSNNGTWLPKIKLSEQPIKTSTPGILQVRRYFDDEGNATADVIWNELEPLPTPCKVIDPFDPSICREMHDSMAFEDLLKPAIRNGKVLNQFPSLHSIRTRTSQQLQKFHSSVLRFDNPQKYSVGLEHGLHDLKLRLVKQSRQIK